MKNTDTVKIELTKKELIDLMLACTAARKLANDGGKKWKDLHDDLRNQLDTNEFYYNLTH